MSISSKQFKTFAQHIATLLRMHTEFKMTEMYYEE